MNRFSQKDIIRGSVTNPGSLNRYSYVQNDPVNFIDPSGEKLTSFAASAASKISSAAKSVASAARGVAKSIASTAKSPTSSAYTSAASAAKAAQAATRASTAAYTGSSSRTNRVQNPGPVQSTVPTVQNIGSYNVVQSTAQAMADARKAADYMNATAPGSPAAQQATRAYLETKRLASVAQATHDPNIARQAVQAPACSDHSLSVVLCS